MTTTTTPPHSQQKSPLSVGSFLDSSASHKDLVTLATRAHAELCLQCHKCTAGCPVSTSMDFPPSRIVRLAQLGRNETLLASQSIWLCTSCQTCSTRCPAGVDPCALQDGLRRISQKEAHLPADPRAAAAADAFLWSIERSGRTHELRMVARYKLKTKTFLEMFFLGIAMFFRGKLKLFGKKAKSPRIIRDIIRRYMRPGQIKD